MGNTVTPGITNGIVAECMCEPTHGWRREVEALEDPRGSQRDRSRDIYVDFSPVDQKRPDNADEIEDLLARMPGQTIQVIDIIENEYDLPLAPMPKPVDMPRDVVSLNGVGEVNSQSSFPISSYVVSDALIRVPARRQVTFAMTATNSVQKSEHSIQPYSEVYGVHPKLFEFDEFGNKMSSPMEKLFNPGVKGGAYRGSGYRDQQDVGTDAMYSPAASWGAW